ncbi:hypothetical protein RHO14_06015 [Orbus wheelerorum]|uniref:hypothetical protein n=1 Tax=Orbus wheelerorum TaxID=3074111 RepID=UPI00370D40D7
MMKMVVGWMLVCYIVAFSWIVPIWFSDESILVATPTKIQHTLTILFIHILISFLIIVSIIVVNLSINKAFIKRNYFVKKYDEKN